MIGGHRIWRKSYTLALDLSNVNRLSNQLADSISDCCGFLVCRTVKAHDLLSFLPFLLFLLLFQKNPLSKTHPFLLPKMYVWFESSAKKGY